MPADPRHLLPLKPLVFQILLALAEGPRHGWNLTGELQARMGGRRLMPGNLYRVLGALTDEGLIEEREPSAAERARAARDTGANADRRRYVGLTAFGREVAEAEAARLDQLVRESRRKKLLPGAR